ncbi:MAG: polysaccharide deacetylase family protein [Bacillota bacterium]
MKSFYLLLIFSFLGGALIACIPPYRRLLHFPADILKGVLAASAAHFLVGTPVSLTTAGFGLMAGNYLFPYPRRSEKKMYGAIAGLLLFMAPDLFLLLLLWAFIIYLSGHNIVEDILMWFYLILPYLMVITGKSDAYIIFSAFVFSTTLMGNFEKLENGFRSLTEKAGWSFYSNYKLSLSPLWRRRIRWSGCLLFVFLMVMGFLLNRYVYRGFGMQVDLFRKGPEQVKIIALTFDDGPNPRFTPQILEILAEEQVEATFFMVGKHVDKYPHIARMVAKAGHEIGNHTYSHANLLQASPQRITKEIEQAEEAIFNATGIRPYLFRPPRGLYNTTVMDESRARGYTIVLWSLSSKDWLELRDVDIINGILSNAGNGDIILFHDSGNLIRSQGGERLTMVRSLKPIIQGLKEQGYDFVTITEMLVISGLSGDI